MTVRSLGLLLVLALTAFACSEPDAPPTDESTEGAASTKAPAPSTDKPASSSSSDEGTSALATDTPATKTPEGDKAVDKATTPTPATDTKKPANDAAPNGASKAAASLATLQACITSCGQDAACAKQCLTDLAGGAKLPALPGGG